MKRELIVNEDEHQFEFDLGGTVAFIEFIRKDDTIYLTHTEVPPSHEGRGIGSELVRQALSYIKKNKWTLMPLCSFVAQYVNNHEEWHSILAEGYQM
jgi:predicted GNAT family acetyltransferase